MDNCEVACVFSRSFIVKNACVGIGIALTEKNS